MKIFKRHLSKTTWLLLFIGLVAGCSNPIVLPSTARLGLSGYKKEEFPFMLTIEAYQHMRFNVHTLDVGEEKVKTTYYIFLKRELGALTTGDFFVGSLGSFYPMLSRGTIRISANKVLIDVEIAQKDSHGAPIPSAWQKSSANGEYQLVRQN